MKHLNYPVLLKVVGMLTLIEGVAMLPSIITGLILEEWQAVSALFPTCIVCVCIGAVTVTQLKFKKINLHLHEGFLIACLSWVYCSVIAMFPYYFSGCGFPLVGSFFEAVAGFTTTGCTVLDINLMPQCLILWRAICHWLGGMGILVLILSIFPLLGISGHSIVSAESPGPSFERLGVNHTDSGKYLYSIYFIFTLIEFVLLLLGPMDFLTALTAAMSSISTAGLIITDANAAMFQDPYSRFIIMIFTLLSTISYILYYMILKGKWREAVRNSEVWSFFSIIGGSTVLIAVFLRISGCYSSLWQAVKDSLCQVVSMISTSGYFVCDYMEWPSFTRTLLFLLLFVGGCSASTAGSLKVIRVVIMIKLVFRGIFKRVHPHAVRPITQEGRAISAAMASSVTMHILLFFGVIIMGTILLSLNNLDMETTFTAVVGIFTNTGLALGQSGTTGYFGMFNEFSQIIMTVLMIAGRLEMYAIILLFTRSFWQPDKAKGI